MQKRELQKIVNPIFTTAKGTVMLLARMGDKDALSLIPHIEVDEEGVRHEVPEDIQKCFMIAQMARYEIHNSAALTSGATNIIDLPSGYAPRGFRVSAAGKRYFGFDLPIVIDTMRPVAEKTMTSAQSALTSYCAVDATNYKSMREALGDIDGDICIVTEGMLGYFNESELISFCQAIRKLLKEFGGTWITADMTGLQLYPLTFEAVLDRDKEMMDAVARNLAARMADVEFYKNSLYLNGIEGAIEFLNNQRLTVKQESATIYMKDIPGIDPVMMQKLRNAYEKIEVFTMTPDAENNKEEMLSDDKDKLPFGVNSKYIDGVLHVKIQGRLDTITAPELLEEFKKTEGKVDTVKMDVSDITFISGAGLRVLQIMCESLEDKSMFELTGVKPLIKEILESVGFDRFRE